MFVLMKNKIGIDSGCKSPKYCSFAYRKEAMFLSIHKRHKSVDPSMLKCDCKGGNDSLNTYGSGRFFQSSPQFFLQDQ